MLLQKLVTHPKDSTNLSFVCGLHHLKTRVCTQDSLKKSGFVSQFIFLIDLALSIYNCTNHRTQLRYWRSHFNICLLKSTECVNKPTNIGKVFYRHWACSSRFWWRHTAVASLIRLLKLATGDERKTKELVYLFCNLICSTKFFHKRVFSFSDAPIENSCNFICWLVHIVQLFFTSSCNSCLLSGFPPLFSSNDLYDGVFDGFLSGSSLSCYCCGAWFGCQHCHSRTFVWHYCWRRGWCPFVEEWSFNR